MMSENNVLDFDVNDIIRLMTQGKQEKQEKQGNQEDQIKEKFEQAARDYPLIQWCEQYLTSQGVFIDIGSDIGSFSTNLSKVCRSVYAFETNIILYKKFVEITNTDNIVINHIDNYNDVFHFDIPKTDQVQLIKINTDNINVLSDATGFLIDHKFPPMIIKVNQNKDILEHLKILGYGIHPVRGCENFYLAGDHAEYKKEDDIDILEEMSNTEIISKYSIEELDQQYRSGSLIEKDWNVYQELSKHYRFKSKHKDSYDCATLALKSAPQNKQFLLYEEISIVAFYINKKDEGYNACDKVIFSHEAKHDLRNSTLNNQAFYMSKMPFSKVITVDFVPPPNFIGTSASIVPDGNGYKICLRTVNYSINPKGGYIMRDPNNVVRTRNFLLSMNSNLKTEKSVELINKSNTKLYNSHIVGMEDARLFGNNEFFCTDLEVNDRQVPQICYCKYDDNGDVISIKPLAVTPHLQCEKNWLPFRVDDDIYFVYNSHPLKLYKLEDENVKLVKELKLSDSRLDDFRGSASLIPYKNGYLCTIHQVYHSNPRKYFHRLIWYDKDFTTMKYSNIFYFESASIEFNLSICHSPEGLLVAYSCNDNSSKIGIFPYEILNSWLNL